MNSESSREICAASPPAHSLIAYTLSTLFAYCVLISLDLEPCSIFLAVLCTFPILFHKPRVQNLLRRPGIDCILRNSISNKQWANLSGMDVAAPASTYRGQKRILPSRRLCPSSKKLLQRYLERRSTVVLYNTPSYTHGLLYIQHLWRLVHDTVYI